MKKREKKSACFASVDMLAWPLFFFSFFFSFSIFYSALSGWKGPIAGWRFGIFHSFSFYYELWRRSSRPKERRLVCHCKPAATAATAILYCKMLTIPDLSMPAHDDDTRPTRWPDSPDRSLRRRVLHLQRRMKRPE